MPDVSSGISQQRWQARLRERLSDQQVADFARDGAICIKQLLTPDEVAGTEVLTYRGIPIRETDALINAEALVS